MFKKISLLLALVLLFSVFAIGCTKEPEVVTPAPVEAETSLKDIQAKGYFILGLDDSFPPMGFKNEANEVVGFDIDLAKEVASRMGVELKIQPISWDAKVLELDTGNIDVIWNGLTITEERKLEMGFSKPYLNNSQIIVVAKNSPSKTKADLADKKVGVQLDSSGQAAVEADKATLDTLGELVKFEDYQTAMMDLKSGGIDAVVVDAVLGRYIMAQNPGTYDVATEDFGEELYGVGFRLEDVSFQVEVDRILDEMREDGKAGEISTVWFEGDIVVK